MRDAVARVQRWVQAPLTLALLRGEFIEGEAVRVDARGGQMTFERIT